MPSMGSNRQALGGQTGSIIDAQGYPIIATETDGETALLFGPSALREILAGVANGDFASPQPDTTLPISDSNRLPYWTFTDVNSAGAITCSVATDSGSASGNTLRWSVTGGAANSLSAKLTRFVPVSSTRNQAFAYQPEVNTYNATNTANSTIRMTAQFYKNDTTTTTGSVNDSGVVTFATLGTGNNWLTGTFTTANAAPADAAFCLITITVATAASGTVVDSTVDIPEVRLIRGDQTNLVAEYRTPGTYAPTYIRQQNGQLEISPNASAGNTKLGGNLTVTGGTIDTAGDMTIAASGGDLIIKDTSASAPRLLFQTSTGTYQGGIRLGAGDNFAFLSSNTTSTYAYVLAARIYPMNGITGSRYIYDDGTYTHFTGAIWSDSTLNGDALLCGSIPTTTATTNAGIWVLNTGSNYTLRRSTSSARYKTNIVDTDEAVLTAAKKIKPRHYESTLSDEAGATRLGFIAEEVEATGLTHAVGYDAEGRVDTLDPTALIAALYARVNDLETRLAALESR
jgi:Chaperone of endosialidase